MSSSINHLDNNQDCVISSVSRSVATGDTFESDQKLMEQSSSDGSSGGAMSGNKKKALSSHFSIVTSAAIVILLTANVLLFIWSNMSPGAWVRLQVIPTLHAKSLLQTDASVASDASDAYDEGLSALSHFSGMWNNLKFGNVAIDDKNNSTRVHGQGINMFSLFSDLHALDNDIGNESLLLLSSDSIESIINKKNFELDKNVFSFSLIQSCHDFWQSKAYMLTILVGFFSGIWPYIKLILLAVCWLCPMNHKLRSNILVGLDQLGKFSFIDLFVTILMTVCFYVKIEEKLSFLGVTVLVTVEPDVGINTFVIGTIISMVFNHIFLFLDRIYVQNELQLEENMLEQNLISPVQEPLRLQENGAPPGNDIFFSAEIEKKKIEKDANCTSELIPDSEVDELREAFLGVHDKNLCFRCCQDMDPLFIRVLPKSLVGIVFRSFALLSIFAALILVIQSLVSSAVRYDMQGLVGLFVSDPMRSFTPIDMFELFGERTNEKIAATYLKSVFLCVVVVFPLLTLINVVVCWFVPMKKKLIVFVSHVVEICCAWASLDVFLLASFAASQELERVSEWILSQNFKWKGTPICAKDGIVQRYSHMECFAVSGHLTNGALILLAAVLTLWFVIAYTFWHVRKMK